MDQIDRRVVEQTQATLDIHWVTERIAVGGWVETDDKMRSAARSGITHIIDMTWECDDTPLAKPYGIKVLVNAVDDDLEPKPPDVFRSGVKFALSALEQPNSKLLIHCVAGRHRGPMMALAVFCRLGWSIEDAMRLISERRPVVDWAPVYVESVRNFLETGNRSSSEWPERGQGSAQPAGYKPDEQTTNR